MDDFNDQDLRVTHYLIPANVTVRFELWEGFGFKELKSCMIALLIGGLLFFISGLFVKTAQYDLKDIPVEETIGIENDKDSTIEGNILTKREKVIPEPVRFLLIVVPTCLTYFCVKRDRSTGMSLMDNITFMREFGKKQKLYLYKYGSGTEG